MAAVSKALGPDWKHNLETHIFALCEKVAEASGDFMALDKASTKEYARLRELREALS